MLYCVLHYHQASVYKTFSGKIGLSQGGVVTDEVITKINLYYLNEVLVDLHCKDLKILVVIVVAVVGEGVREIERDRDSGCA